MEELFIKLIKKLTNQQNLNLTNKQNNKSKQQYNNPNPKMSLSSPLTVIGMINGMIGGFILILPVNALNAGWVFSLLVILIIGAFSYYSCYLCVIHLGDQKDLDYAMFVHFNKNRIVKIVYDLTVFSNLLFLGFLYFELICIQWEGIIGKDSIANPLANTAVLFFLIFILKYFQFGASIMAYGIVSIVGYVIFLMWVIISSPGGNNHWHAFGSGQVNLAAAMGGAFSIQTFFIPVLKKNKSPQKYTFFTLLAYIVGSAVYMYIAFVGGIGIFNLLSLQESQTARQLSMTLKLSSNTFLSVVLKSGSSRSYTLFTYILSFLNLLSSASILFIIQKRKRLFSIFKLKETQKGKIPIPEIIYALIFVGLCLMIRLIKVKINEIVDLNGSVIGFFFIYFLPSILHLRCLYFSKNKISSRDKAILEGKLKDNHNNDQMIIDSRRSNLRVELSEYRRSNDPYTENVHIDEKHQQKQQKQIHQDTKQLPALHRMDSNVESVNQTVKPFRLSEYQSSLKKDQQSQLSHFQQQQQDENESSFFVCDCKKPQNKVLQVLELFVLVGMIGIGAFIMVNGLMTV